jgi:hypothetical protein
MKMALLAIMATVGIGLAGTSGIGRARRAGEHDRRRSDGACQRAGRFVGSVAFAIWESAGFIGTAGRA